MEDMQILLVCSREVLPYGTAEVRTPVGGKPALLLISTIAEISVFSVRVLAGFPEPLMFIGTMVYNQVHHDVHVLVFGLFDYPLYICHRAEVWVGVLVIGYV